MGMHKAMDSNEILYGVKKSVPQSIVSNTDYSHIRGIITLRNNITFHDCQLPNTSRIPRSLKKRWSQVVLDEDMTEDLEKTGAINWSGSNFILQAVIVPRDGNCLVHSTSIAIWGVQDDANVLRELLHKAALSDTDGHFKRRWSRHYLHELSKVTTSSSQIIDREWEDIINSITNNPSRDVCAAVPHRSLEAVHIYILANILRRPIIVIAGSFACSLSGQKLQDNNIAGVYLPLEWLPLECCKTPIILGYHLNHFCPLLSEASSENTKDFLFPLVDKELCFLPIRFLLELEDQKAWDLIQSYLVIKELELKSPGFTPAKIPWVQINFNPPSINVFDVVLKMCEQEHGGSDHTHFGGTNTSIILGAANDPLVPPVIPSAPLMSGFQNEPMMSMVTERCRNNCGYRCSVGTYPFCHECFHREMFNNQQKASAPDIHMSSLTEGRFSGSNSNSFEVISLASSEDENYEILLNERENTYVIKTPDVHKITASPTKLSGPGKVENIVSEILNVSSLREQKPLPLPHAMLGSTARDLQKEKEEKLVGQITRPGSEIVFPSSASFSQSHKTFQARGKPCVTKGCLNFGDPAEDNMCSSCYRAKCFNLPPSNSNAEYFKASQSARRPTVPKGPVFIQTPLLQGPSTLYMQESGSGLSVATRQGEMSHYRSPRDQALLFNKEQLTHPHQLVTSISGVASSAQFPPQKARQEDFPQNLDKVYERTLFSESSGSMCHTKSCNNYGNVNKQGYCNACFDHFKKVVLAAKYGEDVPD